MAPVINVYNHLDPNNIDVMRVYIENNTFADQKNQEIYGFKVSEQNPIDVHYYASLLNIHSHQKDFEVTFHANIVHNCIFIGQMSALIFSDE